LVTFVTTKLLLLLSMVGRADDDDTFVVDESANMFCLCLCLFCFFLKKKSAFARSAFFFTKTLNTHVIFRENSLFFKAKIVIEKCTNALRLL
jgi:hypothetical protein